MVVTVSLLHCLLGYLLRLVKLRFESGFQWNMLVKLFGEGILDGGIGWDGYGVSWYLDWNA